MGKRPRTEPQRSAAHQLVQLHQELTGFPALDYPFADDFHRLLVTDVIEKRLSRLRDDVVKAVLDLPHQEMPFQSQSLDSPVIIRM